MSLARVNDVLLNVPRRLAVLPYRFVYRRNTEDPIDAVLNTTNSHDCKRELEKWFRMKMREVQYVQIAVCPPTLLHAPFAIVQNHQS